VFVFFLIFIFIFLFSLKGEIKNKGRNFALFILFYSPNGASTALCLKKSYTALIGGGVHQVLL